MAKKKPPAVAFLASSAGLEHEAHAYRTGRTAGREVCDAIFKSCCAKVGLFDLDLQKGVFAEQGLRAQAPTGAGYVCCVCSAVDRRSSFAIFKAQFEVGKSFVGQHGARGNGHR